MQFCFADKAYPLCGNGDYNPLTEGCNPINNTVGTRCLDSTYVKPGTPCGGYTLNIASAPATGGDIQLSSPGPNYAAGERVTLVAHAATGYVFAGWAGASTDINLSVTLTMDSNQPLIAMFRPATATLVTTSFPPSGGTIDRKVNGTQETVTAKPETGYTFTRWEGAVTSTDTTITITVDEGKTLVAIFAAIQYTLTANTNPANSGTVFVNGTPSHGNTRHDAGTTVRVEAQPMSEYTFTGWSGSSVAGNPGTIVIDGDRTLTANFKKGENTNTHTHTWTESTVNATCTAPGQVTRNCTCGTTEVVSAIPQLPSDDPSCQTHTHSWTESTVSATCIAPGHVTRSCGCGTTEIVSTVPQLIGTQCESDGVMEGDTLVYQGQRYPTVKIGTQTWMAKNLSYSTGESKCYGEGGQTVLEWDNVNNEPTVVTTLSNDEVQANCDKYGRLYSWEAVMNGATSSNANPSGIRGICPSGWHVPSDAEWTTLVNFVGGESTGGTKLKSKIGWYNNGNGTDNHSFSALPGGSGSSDGYFDGAGIYGNWWSATEIDATDARFRSMNYSSDIVFSLWNYKTHMLSLRCVRD